MSQNGKGDKPRISNYKKYQDNYSEINWSSNKEKEIDNEWHYSDLHKTWSRIENGVRVWYGEKPSEDCDFYPCYICGSEENKPTDFKRFCSRCGNKP